jgi:membrane-associated phospholipid phosphatase
MKSLARWVSIVAHPFVTTLVLVAGVEVERGLPAAARSVGAVTLLFVLPLVLLTGRQVRRGAWETVDASRPQERPLLFAVGGAALCALLAYLAVTQPGSPMLQGGGGVLVMLAVCAAVTRWVKVSIHMAAATLAASLLLARGHPLGWLLALVLPLLAWSRIALGRHRGVEVALGFLIGAVAGALIGRIG